MAMGVKPFPLQKQGKDLSSRRFRAGLLVAGCFYMLGKSTVID
jgi:hypothetical protein